MRNIKITAVLTAFILTFSIFFSDFADIKASAAFEPSVDLYSDAYFMVNLDLGTVIASKNAHKRTYPASITKLMTAIIAYENCSNLDRKMEVTYDATNEFWNNPDPNKNDAATAGLAVGQDNLTMRDCLNALLIASGCEVGNVIACNIAGDIPTFVEMMNKKAQEIGCTDTHFSNTHGLWESDNYSTPYDLFLIAQYAYEKLPELIEISSTQEYVMPANAYNPEPYTLTNYNMLIRNNGENAYYYEYAKGIKTGSINVYWDDSGNEHEGFMNLVSTASMNGFTYMLVTTDAPYYDADGNRTQAHFKDHIALYKWAFKTFDIIEVLNEHTVVANVAVDMGENADLVILKPSSAFSTLLPTDMDTSAIEQRVTITAEVNDNNAVVAPVTKGQVMGTLELVMDGEVLATRNLIASQDIALSQFEYTMRMINSIFEKGWFKLCIGSLAVLIIADVILNGIQKSRIAKLEARQKRRANVNSRSRW